MGHDAYRITIVSCNSSKLRSRAPTRRLKRKPIRSSDPRRKQPMPSSVV